MTEKQKKVREILWKMSEYALALRASWTPVEERKECAQQLRVQAKIILAIPVEDLDIFQEGD